MTQCERIKQHLDEFGSIDALTAMNLYGIMRLASRMSDLKREGYPFFTETVKGYNRYGEPIAYARYVKGVIEDVHQGS